MTFKEFVGVFYGKEIKPYQQTYMDALEKISKRVKRRKKKSEILGNKVAVVTVDDMVDEFRDEGDR